MILISLKSSNHHNAAPDKFKMISLKSSNHHNAAPDKFKMISLKSSNHHNAAPDKFKMISLKSSNHHNAAPDKFKIIITLCRAQKFGDTGPYKNFDFLFNRLPAEIFFTKGFFTMFPNGNSRRITVKLGLDVFHTNESCCNSYFPEIWFRRRERKHCEISEVERHRSSSRLRWPLEVSTFRK